MNNRQAQRIVNSIMKYLYASVTLTSLLLLTACAGQGAKPDAAPASATADLSTEAQVGLFVNNSRLGKIDEVKAGLDAGVPVNAFDSLNQTALIAAISYNSLDEVKLLLAHGADPNLADNAGWTPLHFAAWFGSTSVILKELLDQGANIDAQNDRGITPLYFASVVGHEAQVKLLLDRGANRSIASKTGYTPLRAAKVKGYYAVVALLDPDAAKAAAAKAATPSAGGTH